MRLPMSTITGLLLVAVFVAVLRHLSAGGPLPVRAALAEPTFVGFTVDTAADDTISDTLLTLREAILVANGGTGPGGLNRPASLGEQGQLGGCLFDAGGNASGCGAGYSDTIRFQSAYTIVLTGVLPTLWDIGTTIYDPNRNTRIDAANHEQAFIISGDDVTIGGLRIYGAGVESSNLWIDDPARGVVIVSNVIGTDRPEGACGLSLNSYGGIYISSHSALSPGDAHAWIYDNEIACHHGDPGDGITLAGTDNVVIGSDQHNQVGPGFRNIIRNNVTGVSAYGGAHHNAIVGNYIGTNVSGTIAMPNVIGIALNGAHHNLIGGVNIPPLNLIAGNSSYGILISGTNSATNTVAVNDIGYNSLGGGTTGGIVLPNGSDGIFLNGSRANRIVNGTFVGQNLGSGIHLANGAGENFMSGAAVFSNARYGILLEGGATISNVVQGMNMRGNAFDGIGERGGAHGNLWTNLSIFDNGGLGIDRFADGGDNANAVDGPFALITSASFNGVSVTLSGSKTNGFVVEVYQVATDPSGFGEGKSLVASSFITAGTSWTVNFPAAALGCYTTLEHDDNQASEFGPNSCRSFLPLVQR